MSEIKKEITPNSQEQPPKKVRYVIPFFLALAILTVVAFIIPLRPTKSYSEKRSLAQFPEFSVEALVSGSYFDDITTWFSDTFPGREGWLEMANQVEALHGVTDIYIDGDLPVSIQEETEPAESEEPTEAPTEAETIPEESIPPETMILQETTPPTTPVEEWGGLDAGDDAAISYGEKVVQIGNSVFDFMGFSPYACEQYAGVINDYAEITRELGQDVNIVCAPIPTAIGIMVESEYQEKLHCHRQDEIIDHVLSNLDESVVKVDMFDTLVAHNDEYLYFRTDHHWTALAAYYAYEQVCLSLGKEPAPLESFEEWNQGEFRGSLYYRSKNTGKLELDYVMAYIPQGEITTKIYREDGYGFEWPLLTDMTKSSETSKYMTFIAGDNALTVITNESLPDAPNCVIIKESFGNAAVPFFTQNYHTVYVVDYREYYKLRMRRFVEEYDISDVIFLNNLSAVQSDAVCNLLEYLCG